MRVSKVSSIVDSRVIQKRITDATSFTFRMQEPAVMSMEQLRIESPYGQAFDVWTDGESLYVKVSDVVLQSSKFRNALATLLRVTIGR